MVESGHCDRIVVAIGKNFQVVLRPDEYRHLRRMGRPEQGLEPPKTLGFERREVVRTNIEVPASNGNDFFVRIPESPGFEGIKPTVMLAGVAPVVSFVLEFRVLGANDSQVVPKGDSFNANV